MDGNRIAEYDVDEVAGTGPLLREYIWMDGMPVAVVQGGVVYYIRVDHIGRPVFATDSAANIVWEVNYLPFGGVESSSGTITDLRFPGQWFQLESGLHQNWMRDYDPTTGRYMQADPLGLVDGASVYGYAKQSPMRYIDPMGLDAFVSLTDGAAGGLGHVGLGTDPLQTYGFYASEESGWTACCTDVPGEFLADDMTRVTRMLRISLSSEKTSQVQACIARRRAEPGEYNLFSRSCTDFVRDCLREVGIYAGLANRPDHTLGRTQCGMWTDTGWIAPMSGITPEDGLFRMAQPMEIEEAVLSHKRHSVR